MDRIKDRFDIKAAIHRRASTLTKIARDAGLEESACRAALIRRHREGEKAIAEFLGISLSELWPDRYSVRETERNSNASRAHRASQKWPTHPATKEAA